MTTPHTPSDIAALQARLDATELLMQQLVLVLECDPRFTAARLDRWTSTCVDAMIEKGSVPAPTVAALRALQARVLR